MIVIMPPGIKHEVGMGQRGEQHLVEVFVTQAAGQPHPCSPTERRRKFFDFLIWIAPLLGSRPPARGYRDPEFPDAANR